MLEHRLRGMNAREQFTELGRNLHEKRRTQRVSVRSLIRIAEWDAINFPPPGEFRPVETRDLATTGISYFDTAVPRTKNILIMLGDVTSPIYVAGRIVHSQKCKWSQDLQWFIGCEFISRVNAPNSN